MNRLAQAMVLFLVGGASLRASSTDLYLRYVKAGLRPLLLAAGIVLIAAAIATVWYELRGARATQDDPAEPEHPEPRDHAHREPRISWLLVLPLLGLILVAPPAPGSYTANRTGTALQPPPGFPTLPSGDPLRLSVVDYAGRAVYDRSRSLGDRRVKITGFITLDRSGKPYLTRMVLNCCAADAQPVKVGLAGRIPPILQPDAWLEVVGTYTGEQTRDPINNRVIPFIDISQTRPVPAPDDPYEN
ncbi:TIGR03943 family putative permease subunit [Actinomadura scrupuli]|uniref:TIGR03943 family putative permease subunit n=1 Tax=Actinomadura scrupuli TaxID=559629 RepID=UPI003D9932C4